MITHSDVEALTLMGVTSPGSAHALTAVATVEAQLG